MLEIEFDFLGVGDEFTETLFLNELVIAGWTGRDKEAMEEHMVELEDLGISRPKTTPIFYHLAPYLLTQSATIPVIGSDTSGEVEFFVLSHKNILWVGLGSDHTDRKLEAYNITFSKQTCAKPISKVLWRYDDIAAHWDEVSLFAYVKESGNKVLYQEGSVNSMLSIENLLGKFNSLTKSLPEQTLMFCGTLPVQGGIRPTREFEIELVDPVLNRKIRHQYKVVSLPNQG